jgi:hypothetical protein
VPTVFPSVDCSEGDLEVTGKLFLSEAPGLSDAPDEAREIDVGLHCDYPWLPQYIEMSSDQDLI